MAQPQEVGQGRCNSSFSAGTQFVWVDHDRALGGVDRWKRSRIGLFNYPSSGDITIGEIWRTLFNPDIPLLLQNTGDSEDAILEAMEYRRSSAIWRRVGLSPLWRLESLGATSWGFAPPVQEPVLPATRYAAIPLAGQREDRLANDI